MTRPKTRPDGWPTRQDAAQWSPAEHAIDAAVRAVELAGASPALTDAVALLGKARERVADHVETEEPLTCPPVSLSDECAYHWLHSERGSSDAIAQWTGSHWFLIGEFGCVTPREMARRGWSYLGPVTGRPPSRYLDD